MTDTNPRDLITDLLAALKSWSPTGGGPLEGAEEQAEGALIAKAEAFLAQPEPEPDDPDYYLAWLLFACDGKLRPEAQRVLAAYGIAQPEPPSLKEQALAELAEWESVMDIAPDSPIRRALEQLND